MVKRGSSSKAGLDGEQTEVVCLEWTTAQFGSRRIQYCKLIVHRDARAIYALQTFFAKSNKKDSANHNLG